MSIINSTFEKSRYFILVAIFIFVAIFIPLILSLPASAATPSASFGEDDVSAVWINRITIEVTISGTKYLFIDGGGLNDDEDYKFQIQESSCPGEIRGVPSGFLNEEKAAEELLFDIDFLPPDGECGDIDGNDFRKAVGSPQNAMISFQWVSVDKIESVDAASGWTFADDTSPVSPELFFIRTGESECRDKLLVESNREFAVFYELDKDGRGGDPPAAANTGNSGCKLEEEVGSSPEESNPPSLTRTPLGRMELANSPTGEFSNSGSSGTGGPSCESEGGTFGWVLCPILEFSSKALETVEGWISNKLAIPSEYYDNEGVKGAWANIRNIAYIILIPILLIMVISTALGYSFVDAYTVKRALPRLFMAIIFMALSYQITTMMIEIVNIIGEGVAGLIAAPFGGSDALTLQAIFNPDGADSALIVAGGGIVLAGLGLAAISVVTIGVLASYLFVAALSMLSIFFLLIFRQILLVALIIAAPLAIVSWIFPGNDKLWKIWWQTFSKLLLLYPIVIAAIVTGRAFASIVATSPAAGADTVLSLLVIITAYIAPFFLIPTIFRYAGGAFANIAGIVNNRSKGVFDKQRKYRDGKKAETKQKSENYSRFSDSNRFGRGANSLLGATRAKNFRSTARSVGTGSMASINEARSAGQINQGANELKNDEIWNANQNDDNFLMAVTNRGLAERKLAKARADSIDPTKSADEQRSAMAEIQAREKGLAAASLVKSRNSNATKRTALNSLAKTGYQFSAGQEGYSELAESIDSIAGSDTRARSAMFDETQYHAKNAGRFDLGGINHGNGYDYDAGVDKASGYQAGNAKKETHIAGAQKLVGGDYAGKGKIKTKQADGSVAETSFAATLAQGVSNGTIKGSDVALQHERLLDSRSGATGGNKIEIQAQIDAIEGLINSPITATGPVAALNMAEAVDGITLNRQRIQPMIDPNLIDKT